MRIKLNYLDDSIIVDLFNSLLPDNYFIYAWGKANVKYDSVWKKTNYVIPVKFCRKHKGIMKRIDGDIYAPVHVHNGIVELERMTLNIDPYQWDGEWDTEDIDVNFFTFRDYDALKRAVSYDAKCLAKGCPMVEIKVQA